ncbi:hypothetical protein HK100_011140 [Physocladia obscura]|uniref:SET domain-containing protein n=1 Tax=Physocladia obscura TaxID=109957 RepID=A0AAD5T2L5_9FUNG|nr:hypothetical protein HK100_011140 [Physocladia obscura]
MDSICDWFAADSARQYLAEDKLIENYYSNEVAELGVVPIVVSYVGNGKGKGLVATQDIAAGGRIFNERAAFAMQNMDNHPLARVCGVCLAFLGNKNNTMGNKDNNSSVEIAAVAHLLRRSLTPREIAAVNDAFAAAGLAKHEALDLSCFVEGNDTEMTKTCSTRYCSIECRNYDLRNGHARICPARVEHVDTFIEHATSTNESFLLALKVYAAVAERVASLGLSSPDLSAQEQLKRALWPFRLFAKDYWWNICQPDLDSSAEELTLALKSILKESSQYLKYIFANVPQLTPILTVEFYSLIMGIFEQNNVSLVNPSPVLSIIENLSLTDKILQSKILESVSQLMPENDCYSEHHHDHGSHNGGHSHSHSHGHDYEDDDDRSEDPFEVLDALVAEGNGLHTIHATINHSCTPNAMVFKDASTLVPNNVSKSETKIRNGSTIVIAIKDIKAGEEITVSYLDEGAVNEYDEDEDVEEEKEIDEDHIAWRAMSLKEYGIRKCECPKCAPPQA